MNDFSVDTLNKIKMLCESRNWTVYRLAKEADIPYSSLNNIFIRNTQPTIPTLEKICNGFGITLQEFFAPEIPIYIECRFTTLSKEESALIELHRNLNSEDRKLLITYAYGLLKSLPTE